MKMKMKTKREIIVAVLESVALGAFVLVPPAHAVSPAPDGGYPGFNTAEGQNALLSLDINNGFANAAVGWFSLSSNIEGDFNTATGAGSLLFNTADENTAIGAAALLLNTTGSGNTAVGAAVLVNNTTGNSNTGNGWGALHNNTTGFYNTASGDSALFNNIDGDNNIATGVGALLSNIAGNNNTGIGGSALSDSTGSDNIALGFNAGSNVTTANNVICIGSGGSDVSDTTWINNVYGVTTQSGTTLPVVVSDGGQLGTAASSRRFKEEIKPMERASEAILALKPVTFHYKSDPSVTPHFGLIAEEVAEINPHLVVRDKKGEIYTVRYDAVNAMLLNEFLKEHKKVEEQQATIGQLKANAAKHEVTIAEFKKDIGILTAQLKEQAAQIQKVSDKWELTRSRPQMVFNDR
jgi:Chaperone of endosialidase